MGNRIFILRHGETQFNAQKKLQGHCDSPLTEKGIVQARCVGAMLKYYVRERPFVMYSSPLGRTLQTADIVCDQLGYAPEKVIRDARLKEFSLGDWEQQTIPTLIRARPELLARKDWYVTAPNGEAYSAVQTRLSSWLSDTPKDKDIVVVSHGLAGMTLRGLLLQLTYEQVWQQALPQDAFFIVENGQIDRVHCPVNDSLLQAS